MYLYPQYTYFNSYNFYFIIKNIIIKGTSDIYILMNYTSIETDIILIIFINYLLLIKLYNSSVLYNLFIQIKNSSV